MISSAEKEAGWEQIHLKSGPTLKRIPAIVNQSPHHT